MKAYSDLDFPGIYKITHIPDGKVYVGQAQNIGTRIGSHIASAAIGAKSKILDAIRQCGWDEFEVAALERVDNLGDLTQREYFWVKELDARNPEKGYNVRPVDENGKDVHRGTDNKVETIHLRLDPDILAAINSYAHKLGDDNTSAACRMLIRIGLREMKTKTDEELAKLRSSVSEA